MGFALVGEIDFLVPVFFCAGNLDDWYRCSLDELHVLYVLLHLFLLQNILNFLQQLNRVQPELLTAGSDGDVDVRLRQAQLRSERAEHL